MTTAQREIPDGERLARVETRVEHLDQRMLALEQAMRDLRQEIRDLHAKVDRNFLWTLGIIITMWVTVILSLAGLYTIVLRT